MELVVHGICWSEGIQWALNRAARRIEEKNVSGQTLQSPTLGAAVIGIDDDQALLKNWLHENN